MGSMIEELLKNNEGLIDQNKKLLGENIGLMKESELLMRENFTLKTLSPLMTDVIESIDNPEKLSEVLFSIMNQNKNLMEANLSYMKEIDMINTQERASVTQNAELATHCEALITEGENNMQQNIKLMSIAKQMMDNNVKLVSELERQKSEKANKQNMQVKA
jgi:hypothetical protein